MKSGFLFLSEILESIPQERSEPLSILDSFKKPNRVSEAIPVF